MDDKFKRDLIKILNQELEKRFTKLFDQSFQKVRKEIREDAIHLFNQGFEEVVLPQLEEIREGIHEVKGVVNRLDTRVEQLDRKLDITHDKVLDYDKRLKDIEAIPVIAHQIKK